MAENFRREPIRSRAYLDGSRGQPCKLNIVGVCTGDAETTIAAHIRDETFGGAQKADDTSIVDSCFACHDAFDARGRAPMSEVEWLRYALRGLQRTIRDRVQRGIAKIKLDATKPAHERPTPARKPKSQRAVIKSRNEWPQGQKIQSRNDLRRKERT